MHLKKQAPATKAFGLRGKWWLLGHMLSLWLCQGAWELFFVTSSFHAAGTVEYLLDMLSLRPSGGEALPPREVRPHPSEVRLLDLVHSCQESLEVWPRQTPTVLECDLCAIQPNHRAPGAD